MELRLRPASEEGREFLYALHCHTMREVIEKTWGWDETWQLRDFDRRFREYVVSVSVPAVSSFSTWSSTLVTVPPTIGSF